MARIIAIANQKGGVGKTTTAGNLGVSLATSGRRVLLLDLDHQQSLAASFHVALPDTGLAEVLTGNVDIKDVIVEVERGIYLVGGADLALAERRLAEEPGAELVLRQALTSLAKKFDFVLLDCAPSLGLLTVSALTAAGEVLIPAQPEYLVLRQAAEILETIDKVRARLNTRLKILGFLPVMYDGRNGSHRDGIEILSGIAEEHGTRLFDAIPRTVRASEAPIIGKALVQYDPKNRAAQAYQKLAEDI